MQLIYGLVKELQAISQQTDNATIVYKFSLTCHLVSINLYILFKIRK